MKKLIVIATLLLMANVVWAQNPPTNAAQFQVNLNFLLGTPYGQSSALSNAFTDQLTTNAKLRADLIVMPGVGYTGYFGGVQYDLAALCPLLATTSINCGKFMAYANGAVGIGRVQLGTNPADKSIAGLLRTGANYDVTGSGKYTLNLYECGWGHFGPNQNGWFCQTGFGLGLGTNVAATQAKLQRWQKSQAKKQAKLAKAAAKRT